MRIQNKSAISRAPWVSCLTVALLWLVATGMASASTLQARGYKMAGDALRVRIVLQFDQRPDVKWFLLRGPHRLAIDLPETAFAIDPRELEPRGLISRVRYGNLGEGRSRMILTAEGPFEVEKVAVMENESSPGYRLVADIVASSDARFELAMAKQAVTSAAESAPKSDRLGGSAGGADRRFTIVIDPGHGGIDGGAEGLTGTVEKNVTLAFAKELRKRLEQAGPYAVFMTREKDEFLRLDERVRIARQHEADLFISIHADTIRHKSLRGATIYTMSDKASDAEAEATADRENLADEIAGMHIENENQEVADILVDLVRRETHSFSIGFARSLVGTLGDSIQLINNPHRSAGFRVLKAPDVPSVLVELGYLSNPKDEAQLRSEEWRGKAAESITAAINQFAGARIGAGG